MAPRVRTASARRDDPQTYPDTMSGYGPTRADSRGAKPDYPYAYKAQASTAYKKFQQPNRGMRNGGEEGPKS